jgi:hypothetical protein
VTTKDPQDDLTVTQKVILAAYALEKQGNTSFSAEALIVACWKSNKKTFGLKGFADEHPDSNRVLAVIMGERGLARQGWLNKEGMKVYSLSEKGRKEAERIQRGDEPPPRAKPDRSRAPSPAKVNRDTEKFILRITTTQAIRRYRTGAKFEITFRDACAFWGVADPTDLLTVRKAASEIPAEIARADEMFNGDKLVLSNGQLVTRDEIRQIEAVHNFLSDQFARQLDLSRVRR